MTMTIWDDWKKKAEAERKLGVTTVYLSHDRIEEQKATPRVMTDREKEMASRLSRCSLKRTTYHTRMVEALVEAGRSDAEITERQAWTLEGLYYMYRRQHGDKSAKKPEGWQ